MINFLGKIALYLCIFSLLFIIVFVVFIGKVDSSLNNLENETNIEIKSSDVFNNKNLFNALDKEMEKLIGH